MSTFLVSSRPKVVLIGDSITQFSFSTAEHGWGAALADWYSRSADVINRGYSGYNSQWMKYVVKRILPTPDHEIILATVFLGANDASSGSQHVPVEEYASNLKEIVKHLRYINPAMHIVLITPPIVDAAQWPDRHPEVVKKYAVAVIEVGHAGLMESGGFVHVLNLWSEESIGVSNSSVFSGQGIDYPDLNDGLHLGVGGNTKVFENLRDCILKHIRSPVLIPSNVEEIPNGEKIALHFPHWSDASNLSTPEERKEMIEKWSW
jgi:lysophospholipase L1-like esterase